MMKLLLHCDIHRPYGIFLIYDSSCNKAGVKCGTINGIMVRTKSCGGCRIEKLPLVEMKDALDNGGRVTILIRHAERPPLNPNDKTFGASLPLTENGWRWAQNFGVMLANNLQPKSVAFYAGETFRTIQTACAMAMSLDILSADQPRERKVRIGDFLGSASPLLECTPSQP